MASNPVDLEMIDLIAAGATSQVVADLSVAARDELNYFTQMAHILRMAKARACEEGS